MPKKKKKISKKPKTTIHTSPIVTIVGVIGIIITFSIIVFLAIQSISIQQSNDSADVPKSDITQPLIQPEVHTTVTDTPQNNVEEQVVSDELRTCSLDSDCIKISQNCCGCNQGGQNIAINSSAQDAFMRTLGNCGRIACIQVISTHWTCQNSVEAVCQDNLCTLTQPLR